LDRGDAEKREERGLVRKSGERDGGWKGRVGRHGREEGILGKSEERGLVGRSGEREGGWKWKSVGRILGRKGKRGFVWKS
jgi:hypothetical protein